MPSPIPKPTRDDYLFTDSNADWLNTPSPFDELDDEWYQLIIFYVFHVPDPSSSARAKSLDQFGWGTKSKTNDFKQLKKNLIQYSNMTKESFLCKDGWAQLKTAFQDNNLSNFPCETSIERVTYRKSKTGEIDSLMAHIRNAFAHGRVAFYSEDEEVYVGMEDIDDKRHVSARMIISKSTLQRWKRIIEEGPFIENSELEIMLNLSNQ